MSGFVTRFAPSPTGYLHRGHAFSALTAFEAAKSQAGHFLLRIEDIDATRCRSEYEAAIYADLAWLGITWDEPVRRQSEHMADYRAALDRLNQRGLVYRCFRTRKEILQEIGHAPHGLPEAFHGNPLGPVEEARRLTAGEPFAWRLSLDRAKALLGASWGSLAFTEEGFGPQGQTGRLPADPSAAGDVVLARKDVGVAYHLAVVIDDALQSVSHVVRGEDLFEATPIQRLLQVLLDLPEPAYRHHRLLTGPDGRRYAKRDKAETLRALRARGVSRDEVIEEIRGGSGGRW